ncbi:complement C1q-like protein 4 [Cebidichthys violaceus]|uniref:complement C1q-like protein 4 n=1 Tax=Cebidichthys violaceus TaxID=271503 RepID=UPI0035CA1FFE
MESFFNMSVEELSKNLTNSKMALNDMRASRSAFSVTLHDNKNDDCFGPYTDDRVVRYQHVYLNLGNGYDSQSGTFTAPRSGVYSLAVTVHSDGVIGPGAHLAVNGQVVASLQENKSQDVEDSATAVVSVKLKAGDKVAVNLPKGSLICDRHSYLNTFTGFLLYPC